ncbi:MAG TPA: hypothetical protein VFR43_05495 [Gaiellaceae bacterium]|nr:hypothetical protein [Gaiellaceae bacterium]
MPSGSVLIGERFRGPASSGNGGYACGLLAGFVDAPAVEVTLRLPPPLGRPLAVELEAGRAVLLDDGALVAEGVAAELEADVPPPVGWEAASEAAKRYPGLSEHPFPECFVCGPARRAGDGLRVFAGPVAGRDGLVAAPWRAREVEPAVVWAAIDCPGAFAAGAVPRGSVLGRMTAAVYRLPAEGEECVSAGWPVGVDGRKLFAGTALYGADGQVLAASRQTWVAPRDP